MDPEFWHLEVSRALKLQQQTHDPANDIVRRAIDPFLGPSTPTPQFSIVTQTSWEDVAPHLAVQAYRCLRHAGIVAGLVPTDAPLFFARENLLARDPSARSWAIPTTPGVTTAPGYDLVRDRLEGDPALFATQPSTPLTTDPRSQAHFRQFFAVIAAAAHALDLEQESELGIDEVAPDLLHPDPPQLFAHWPTDSDLLSVEHTLLSALSDLLSKGSERAVRGWLSRALPAGPFEAFSLVQAARRWTAAHRPIDLEVDRALLLAELDQAADQARQAHDHRAVVAATAQRARILGLHEHGDQRQRGFQEALEEFSDFVKKAESDLQTLPSSSLPSLPASVSESPFAPLPEEDLL